MGNALDILRKMAEDNRGKGTAEVQASRGLPITYDPLAMAKHVSY